MDFIKREEFLHMMNETLGPIMETYNLEDVGIYEEQGAGDTYYLGYTVRKDGKIYMVNTSCAKNDHGELAVKEYEWTIQTDEGNEKKGFHTLKDVFEEIDSGYIH